MPRVQRITPCLWFDSQAEEAAQFYTSVWPDAEVLGSVRYGVEDPGRVGQALTVSWRLGDTEYVGLNGGPQNFAFTEAISFQILCADQDEVDHYWNALTDGGEESQCGWLKDRFGVSWQVVPKGLDEVFGDADPERARRAMNAMLSMRKLDIGELRRAAEGAPA